jgi:hypothetical protein
MGERRIPNLSVFKREGSFECDANECDVTTYSSVAFFREFNKNLALMQLCGRPKARTCFNFMSPFFSLYYTEKGYSYIMHHAAYNRFSNE